MSLDCEFEEIYQRPRRDLISYILKVGEAHQMLTDLIVDEKFANLSKHNPYWDSEHEAEADKLDEIRLRWQWINEKLCEISEKLD